ncbi:MAG TPA: alpha/beta hydrolase [Myxococcota bacterium]|nr:alpha/beta hydrolase [Myxococcota bacterium]
MVAIPSEGLGAGQALEGLFLRALGPSRGGAVIAPPHPLYGGSMENAVVSELAFACAKAGLSSLRFNWRGVGASAGTPSGDPQHAAEDYAAALAQLRDTAPGILVLCGYSFGAAGAVAQLADAAGRTASRLLLVAPPPQLLDLERLRTFRGEVLLLTGQRDGIAPPAALQGIAEELGACKLVVLPHTDHFFAAGLAELSRESEAWLRAASGGEPMPTAQGPDQSGRRSPPRSGP